MLDLIFSMHNVQVRLELMGIKAKNATYISGNEAGKKISREVVEVEKRHTVKGTSYCTRSSWSHCMVVLLRYICCKHAVSKRLAFSLALLCVASVDSIRYVVCGRKAHASGHGWL